MKVCIKPSVTPSRISAVLQGPVSVQKWKLVEAVSWFYEAHVRACVQESAMSNISRSRLHSALRSPVNESRFKIHITVQWKSVQIIQSSKKLYKFCQWNLTFLTQATYTYISISLPFIFKFLCMCFESLSFRTRSFHSQFYNIYHHNDTQWPTETLEDC